MGTYPVLLPVFGIGHRLPVPELDAAAGGMGRHGRVFPAGSAPGTSAPENGGGRLGAGAENVQRHRHIFAHRRDHRPVAQRRNDRVFHLPRLADHPAEAVFAGGVSADLLHLLRAGHVLRRYRHGGRDPDGPGPIRRRQRRRHGGSGHRRVVFRRPLLPGLLQRLAGGRRHGYGAVRQPAPHAPHRLAALFGDAGGLRCAVRSQPAVSPGRGYAGGVVPALRPAALDGAARAADPAAAPV